MCCAVEIDTTRYTRPTHSTRWPSLTSMNIYLYGNCQSTALRKLITEAQPGWTVANTDISAVPVFTDTIVAAHLARAAAADIVIAQPIGAFRDRADLSIDHLRASLPPHVTLMTFPSMFFNGLQAAYDYMVGHFPGHRSDYHNAHSIDMFLNGYNWHDIAAVQLSPEFYNRDFVFSWIDAALADLKRREIDHQTTIRFSPFLEERCWTEVTMNTVNHPRRPALAYMVREIFQILGLHGTVRDEGEECIPTPVYPPLPTVLHHLGLPDATPLLVFPDGVCSRSEHVFGSLRLCAHYGRTAIRAGYAQSRLAAFIEAFRAAPLPLIDALAPAEMLTFAPDVLVKETYRNLLRREASAEDVSHHARAVQAMGVSVWLHAMTQSAEFKALTASHS
jgi:hypothetical protein